MKSQSAMEYLMTYGWAILIIAVVLGALFELGFFNSANLAPKASPGSCQVYRPQGPWTTAFEGLEGTCNNELPQYVAQFNSGDASSIYAAPTPISALTTNYSVSQWFMIYTGSSGNGYPIIDIYNASVNEGIGGSQNFDFGGSWAGGSSSNFGWGIYWPQNWQFCSTPSGSISPGIIYNAVVTAVGYNSIDIYIDGKLSSSCTLSASMPTVQEYSTALALAVGSNPPGGLELGTEQVSNIQLYNTSLTANQVDALYLEGIGGEPIYLNNLVGWWPLNGNANDYSGNHNNGVLSGVIFTSGWDSRYTPV